MAESRPKTSVLVVEDEKKLNKMICDYLSSVGFETYSAFSGPEAVEIREQKNPDLIVLDILLPGFDGMEITRNIRKNSNVPIIMLTARSTESDKLIGLELGADDYMTKPFSMRELAARIRALLRRSFEYKAGSDTEKTGITRYRDLEIDTGRMRVKRGNDVIALTHVQFEILHKMLSNPGRVYSRLELLESFQESAFEGYERTIDVHIKNLRKALEPDPRNPIFIETVRGVGYRIAEVVED